MQKYGEVEWLLFVHRRTASSLLNPTKNLEVNVTADRRPVSLWYSYGPDTLKVQVGPRGFLFGRGSTEAGVDIDLSPISRRVFGSHCRIWLIRGEHILYNTCLKADATFVAREVKDAAKSGNVRIELPGGKEPLVLALGEVRVESVLDLSQDCILLVSPSAPDGQVLLRFHPDPDGSYDLVVTTCKVLEVIK